MEEAMPRLSDQAEDILESLWVATVEGHTEAGSGGQQIGLQQSDAVQELLEQHLVEFREDLPVLTQQGEEMARGVVRRHRLAARLLSDILEMGGETMDSAACGFEHSLQEGVEEAICTLLGHPTACPHGRPIPPGPCCRSQVRNPQRVVTPLTQLKSRESGQIAYIQTGEARRLQKLLAMGVMPGKDITLIQRFPSFVFQVGHSQFAVDEEIASAIYVRCKGG
jgi:DtxR family transcriptional regulator, Mn-dependent transcriptional regulator